MIPVDITTLFLLFTLFLCHFGHTDCYSKGLSNKIYSDQDEKTEFYTEVYKINFNPTNQMYRKRSVNSITTISPWVATFVVSSTIWILWNSFNTSCHLRNGNLFFPSRWCTQCERFGRMFKLSLRRCTSSLWKENKEG